MKYRNLGSIILALIALFILSAVIVGSEEAKTGKAAIKWNRYDAGLRLAAQTNRPMLVDFYTGWCGWCKKMDRETFTDSVVADYINTHFVAVKVNAESKNTLQTPSGTLSEVQLARSFGVSSYPNYWFLESNGNKINNLPGYAPAPKFMLVLRYIGDGIYKKQTWKEYLSKATASD